MASLLLLPAAWFARQAAAGLAPCSPLTNLPMARLHLTANRALAGIIQALQSAGLLSPRKSVRG